jgi:hypothetical protein
MQTTISTSFVQDSRHATKSQRFVPVQPSQLALVLADHGFSLNHLKTGHARNPERADHQTTIARYVAHDSADICSLLGDGSSLDLLVRAPHLTGAIELRLGFFRGVCANQWNAGKLLASVRVSHMGNCLETLNRAIPQLVAQRSELADAITRMSAQTVTPAQLAGLAQSVADIRMAGIDNVQRAHVSDLLRPRRAADARSDLFSVANVLQENALRFGMRYELAGAEAIRSRNMITRKVIETSATAIEMTGNIWEAAAQLLSA